MNRRYRRGQIRKILLMVLAPALLAGLLFALAENRDRESAGGISRQELQAGGAESGTDAGVYSGTASGTGAEGGSPLKPPAGGYYTGVPKEEYASPLQDIAFADGVLEADRDAYRRSIPVRIDAAILGGEKGAHAWAVFLPAETAQEPQIIFSRYEEVSFRPLGEGERLPGPQYMAPGSVKSGVAGQESGAEAGEEAGAASGGADGAADAGDGKGGSTGNRTYASGDRVKGLADGSAFRVRMAAGDGTEQEEDLYVFSCTGTATMYLDTESGSMAAVDADETKQTSETARFVVCTPDGLVDSSGECRVSGRGNSTWTMKKRPYNVNLTDKKSVLGMEACKKFCLLANVFDHTNLLDRVSAQLAISLGMRDTPQGEFVNLYLNGQYNGLYYLSERVRTGGSVHIKKLDNKILKANGLWKKTGDSAAELLGEAGDEDDGEDLTERPGGPEDSAAGVDGGLTAGSGGAEGTDQGKTGAGTAASGSGQQDGKEPEAPAGTELSDAGGSDAGTAGQDSALGRLPKRIPLHEEEDRLKKWAYDWPNEPADNTGGYLLQVHERYDGEDCWFSTEHRRFRITSPAYPTVGEVEYLQDYMLAAERAIYSEDGRDPETGRAYTSFLDMDSWQDMYLLEEYFAEWDGERWSFFITKDRDDPLLYCGPMWDFDHSAGTMIYGTYPETAVSLLLFRDTRHGWMNRLLSHSEFEEDLHARWRERFSPAVHAFLEDRMEEEIAAIESAAYMNNIRRANDVDFRGDAQALVTWLGRRAAFLDGYAADPDAYCRVEFQFGWGSLSHYVERGRALGFLPLPAYGETQVPSQVEKNEILGWQDEDGREISADIVIDRDRVFAPVYR